jgi:uncharacterized protein
MNQYHQDPVPIPYSELAVDVLDGIIKDFVLREGTDYGISEHTLEEKSAQVMSQIRSGKAQIFFDAETETCTIVPL